MTTQSSLRNLARRLGAGKVLYAAWHQPRRWFERLFRQGAGTMYSIARGEQEMRSAAFALPPLADAPPSNPEIHFLTGHRFIHQTIFCAYSLVKSSDRMFRWVLYDDGSLKRSDMEAMERAFPRSVRVVGLKEIGERLNRVLPESRYPTLRSRRRVYPNLRKLTDIHAGTEGWKLVLDSDMLFFDRPAGLLDWMANPAEPLLMKDVKTSYGYSLELLAELAGGPVEERLNVGVCGLKSEDLDFSQLEEWNRELIARSGASYFEEQALTAMLMTRFSPKVLPEKLYICMPKVSDVENETGVLHHYVADSKAAYFQSAWRRLDARWRA